MTELPSGWTWVSLGDLGRWCGGGTPSKSNLAFWTNGTVPWVSPKDMKVHVITDSEDHVTEAAVRGSTATMVPPGSVLVVTRSGILRRKLPVALTASAVAINQDLKALTPASGVNPSYVAWALRHDERAILSESTKDGTTVDSVDFAQFLSRKIALAPTSEQERIVAAIEEQFSRLEAGAAAMEGARQKLKRMRSSVLQSAVSGRLPVGHLDTATLESLDPSTERRARRRAGRLWGSGLVPQLTEDERTALPPHWHWAKVGDLGFGSADTVQVGPMSMRSADFAATGVPVLNVGSVQWAGIDEAKLNYMPDAIAAGFSRYRIEPGDVLFTRSGTVGRSAVANEEQRGWLMTFHLLRVRPNPSVCLPEWGHPGIEWVTG